jgi:hypothetical protein
MPRVIGYCQLGCTKEITIAEAAITVLQRSTALRDLLHSATAQAGVEGALTGGVYAVSFGYQASGLNGILSRTRSRGWPELRGIARPGVIWSAGF